MNPQGPLIVLGLAAPVSILVGIAVRERRHRAALEEYCQPRSYRFNPEHPGAEEAMAGTRVAATIHG